VTRIAVRQGEAAHPEHHRTDLAVHRIAVWQESHRGLTIEEDSPGEQCPRNVRVNSNAARQRLGSGAGRAQSANPSDASLMARE